MSAVLVAASVLILLAGGLGLRALVARPQRGVLLLAALVPFDGLLYVIPHPAVLEGWKEGLVLLTLVATLLAPPSARAGRGRRGVPDWVPALVGLVAVSVASALAVGGTQAAVGLKINFFYALVALVLWCCPFDARERDRLVSLLMGIAVLTALVGLWQQAVGPEYLRALGYEYDTTIRTANGVLRSFSTFNQPFPFALFLMLAVLIGVPIALAEPRRWRNAIFLACGPLLVLGMISSIVRAALVATAVGLTYLALHRYRVILHGVPPLVVAAVLVPGAVYAALVSAASLRERMDGWADIGQLVVGAPLGAGIGSTGSASEKSAAIVSGVRASSEVSGYQPDNYYVKTLLELGSIGLWMFLLLLLGALVAARRAARAATGSDAALGDGITATLLGAAAASFVATYFEIFPLDVYFWLTLGVLTSLPSSSSTPSPCVQPAAASRPTPAS